MSRRIRPPYLHVAAAAAAMLFANWAAADPLGDCSAEAQLGNRSDVVMCEPWETPSWWEDHGFFESDRDPMSCDSIPNSAGQQECHATGTHPVIRSSSVVSQVAPGVPCISGNCLEVDLPTGDVGHFSTKWLFKEHLGYEPQEMYFRYYMRFSDGWDPELCTTGLDEGGKLLGLSHTKVNSDPEGQCGNGGSIPNEERHCWSMRAMHKSCTESGRDVCETQPDTTFQYGAYAYFPGQATNHGSNGMFHDGRDHWSSAGGSGGTCTSNPNNMKCGIGDGGMLAPGRWYQVEMYVKMNTLGQSNGVLRGWVDGVLSYDKTNMIYRVDGHDEIHVREAWLNVYMGGVQGSCAPLKIYLDQMVLATASPIGLIDVEQNEPTDPPLPPTEPRVE